MDSKRSLLIRDAQGETIDELLLDDEEPFLLESFSNLIASHDRVGRKLILARVEISSEGENGATAGTETGNTIQQIGANENNASVKVQKPHYYSAHQINKVIFRKAGKSWIFRLYARDPLTNLEILGDVKYFMVVPVNHSFNDTNARPKSSPGNYNPPPLPQRVESFVPTCSKPLSSRRTSFDRLMRSALGDDQKDLKIAELSGPRIPEFHGQEHNQRTGKSGSVSTATRPRSLSYLYLPQSRYVPQDSKGSISESSHVIDSKTAEYGSGEHEHFSNMHVSESILSMSLPSRERAGSDTSLKITLHRKSIAEGIPPGKMADQKSYNFANPGMQSSKSKNNEYPGSRVKEDIYRSATLSENFCEEDEMVDNERLIPAKNSNPHSKRAMDSARTPDDSLYKLQPKSDLESNERLNSASRILEKPIDAISELQYHAVFIGTDDNFLTKSQLRQLFEANALEQIDSELFDIPKELLEQEGIMLTEEDERDEAPENLPMVTAPAQQPIARTDLVSAMAAGRIGERHPSTDFLTSTEYLEDESDDGYLNVDGHAVVDDPLGSEERGRRMRTAASHSQDGSHSGLSPLESRTWVRHNGAHLCPFSHCYGSVKLFIRKYKFSCILIAGFLIATVLKFVLPADKSLMGILMVLGISAVSIVVILYRNRRRNAR